MAVRFPRDRSSSVRRQCRVGEFVGTVVLTPELIYADFDGTESGWPVMVSRWVDAMPLDEVLRSSPTMARDLGQVMGRVVASLAQCGLSRPGWFTDTLEIEPRERGLAAGIVAHVQSMLFDSAGGRGLDPVVRNKFWRLITEHVHGVDSVEDHASLVHGDLAPRNVLVRRSSAGWEVAAVLDWEFAMSGSSLLDVGHLVRHGPPGLDLGVEAAMAAAGMGLPAGWRKLAWLLDSVSLTGPLARHAGHPDRDASVAAITRSVDRIRWESS